MKPSRLFGNIPEGWRLVRLGDAAEVAFSGVDKRTIEGEVPVKLCNYTDVFYNRRIQASMDFMPATATQSELKRWALKQGDVLFTKDSETADEIGVPAFVADDLTNVLCGYHLGLARPSQATVNGSFLARILASRESAQEFGRIANGITRFGLTLDATRNLPILLPPLPEQRAIAAVLDSIDDAIERTGAVIAATEELRDSLLHQLLTRGVPGWHTEWKEAPGLGTTPAGWEVVRLGEVAEIQTGKAVNRQSPAGGEVQIPYLSVANVKDGYLDLSEVKTLQVYWGETERYGLKAGDVLFTEGGDADKLGRGTVWREEIPLCIHQNHVFAVRPHSEELMPVFLAFFAASRYGKKYFLGAAKQTTNLASINSTQLREMPLPLPNIREQQAIAELLDGMDATIAEAKRERDGLQLLKGSTADALLTGQIRVEGT